MPVRPPLPGSPRTPRHLRSPMFPSSGIATRSAGLRGAARDTDHGASTPHRVVAARTGAVASPGPTGVSA